MTSLDIAGMWRSMRVASTEAPRPGANQQTAGADITISVAQECQIALPLQNSAADEVTVTVSSNRPGVSAQVLIGANLNSADGSYQGPTTQVGQGQFTATASDVEGRFVVLPAAAWPVLGVGAVATWEDGAPHSVALTYEQLACDPLTWWQWLIQVLGTVIRPFVRR